MQIYVMIDGNRHGPYSPEEVRQYLATGQLQPQMPAWCEGKTDWQPLETFPEFAPPAAKPGRKPGRSRTPLYASLAVGAVALCAVAGWLVWHGKQSNGSETTTGASPAAGTPDIFASHPDWPKTLAELNKWYAEPPAGQNAAEVFRQGYDAMKEQISAQQQECESARYGQSHHSSSGQSGAGRDEESDCRVHAAKQNSLGFFSTGITFDPKPLSA